MNQRQASELDKAIAKCGELGIEPSGQGHMKHGSQRFFLVPSQSDPSRSHVVIVDRSRLICDCLGALYGHVCVHRASVHAFLVVEASKAESRAERVTQELERESVEIERTDRQEAEAATERSHRRETAVLVSSSRAFSLYK